MGDVPPDIEQWLQRHPEAGSSWPIMIGLHNDAIDDALLLKLTSSSWADTTGRPNDDRWSPAVNRLTPFKRLSGVERAPGKHVVILFRTSYLHQGSNHA